MVGDNTMTEEQAGQSTVSLTEDVGYVPATVHAHTEDREGLVLHTRGDSNDTDIRVFPDDREAVRLGEIEEAS